MALDVCSPSTVADPLDIETCNERDSTVELGPPGHYEVMGEKPFSADFFW